MFAKQKRLTTNPLTFKEGIRFDFDEIYVPLGLVERKQQEKLSEDIAPEQGSCLYEPEDKREQKQPQEERLESEYKIANTYQNNEFFEQVLKQAKSPQSQGRKLAIIGEPGAGKTTLLQKIADWVFKTTERELVVWISLADLKKKKLEDYLLKDWLKSALKVVHVTPDQENSLAEQFHSNRVWLLLDGVDEIAAESVNILATIANQIDGWVGEARVVLTCRLNVWDTSKNALADFDVYRNLEFSYPEQVKEFINHWFAKEPNRGKRLQTELERAGRERIHNTIKNPLRLALLCRTWQRREGNLPSTKAALYKQFTEALYDWKQDIFPTKSAKRQELNNALSRLALQAISQETSRFRMLDRLVYEELGEADEEDSLLWLALKLGWLNRVGIAEENPDENVYAFFHPTFQEYFASLAIKDWHYLLNHDNRLHNPLLNPNPSLEFNEGQPNYRIFEPQWKEVILLWFGREDVDLKNKEKFLTALFGFQDGCQGFYSYRTLFLSAVCIAEFEKSSLAVDIAEQLVKLSYFWAESKFSYQPIREKASELLEESNHGAVVSAIVNFIQRTESENVPIDAVKKLGKIGHGNERAIQALVKLIQTSPSRDTLEQAINSLGEIACGNEVAIKVLVNLLETPWRLSWNFDIEIENLIKISSNNEIAIEALINLIQTTQSYWTLGQAVESLRKIGCDNQTLITTLINLTNSAQNEDICRQAAESLGEIAQGSEEAVQTLFNLIQTTQSSLTLQQAVESLRKISCDDQTLITTLINLTNSAPNEYIRRQAAESLGEIAQDSEEAKVAVLNLFQETQNR
jgi:HEAT repeat protein/energy-coupling factor transporter ATP-binding protein EcfA2